MMIWIVDIVVVRGVEIIVWVFVRIVIAVIGHIDNQASPIPPSVNLEQPVNTREQEYITQHYALGRRRRVGTRSSHSTCAKLVREHLSLSVRDPEVGATLPVEGRSMPW